MTFSFHCEAREEASEAAAYYERCQPGLGGDFTQEVDAAIARILQYPEAWPKVSGSARQCRMNRFPYGIVYRLRPDSTRIYAVAHLSRMPGYWESRLRDEE